MPRQKGQTHVPTSLDQVLPDHHESPTQDVSPNTGNSSGNKNNDGAIGKQGSKSKDENTGNSSSNKNNEGNTSNSSSNESEEGTTGNNCSGENNDEGITNNSRTIENEDGSDDEEEKTTQARRSLTGGRALESLLGAVDDDFFANSESDDDGSSESEKLFSPSPVRRGRPRTSNEIPIPKPSAGAPEREMQVYKKALKNYYDRERYRKMKSPSKHPVEHFTGVHHPTLRTMAEVEKSRLEKGNTFRSKDILLLRTKEEANLRGISIKVEKSDVTRFICWSRDTPSFVVIAYRSMSKGYEVRVALTREMDTDQDWDGIIPGAAKNSKSKKTKALVSSQEKKPRGRITPYKAKDLVPLVRRAVSTNPSLSNKDMTSVLAPYGKSGKYVSVFTDSLLQNTRKLARIELFGDPKTNATYAPALESELKKHGHDNKVRYCPNIAAPEKAGRKKNLGRFKTPLEKKAKRQKKKDKAAPITEMELGDGVEGTTEMELGDGVVGVV